MKPLPSISVFRDRQGNVVLRTYADITREKSEYYEMTMPPDYAINLASDLLEKALKPKLPGIPAE